MSGLLGEATGWARDGGRALLAQAELQRPIFHHLRAAAVGGSADMFAHAKGARSKVGEAEASDGLTSLKEVRDAGGGSEGGRGGGREGAGAGGRR